MKLFINDWNGDKENFIMNKEENIEYKINTWITSGDNHPVYLMSAYLYDEFVMFFYIYEKKYSYEYAEQASFKIPQTNRDWITQSEKSLNRITFGYEVNHLKSERGSSGECLPRQKPEGIPAEEQDEFFEMYFSEYDYLYSLVKDRLPEELQGAALAFRKDCYSFSESVTKIEHIAIYPSNHKFRRHFIDKTFTVPYGECDIKIPYVVNGTESYIIVQELKVFDMLKEIEEKYDEFKKTHDNSLKELEENKDKKNQTVMDLDEIRKHWDKRILTISYLKPEEHRSFEFYITEYLNAEIQSAASGSAAMVYFFSPDKDNRMIEGLYKDISALGEVSDNPKAEYEFTLMWISEPVERDRNAIFEATF